VPQKCNNSYSLEENEFISNYFRDKRKNEKSKGRRKKLRE
jgi:hypothetical protein